MPCNSTLEQGMASGRGGTIYREGAFYCSKTPTRWAEDWQWTPHLMEEQVLEIMHPEGLAGVVGGLNSGDDGNGTGQVSRDPAPAEEQYLCFREELRAINSTLGTIVGVLKEVLNTRRDTVAQQGAPDTSLDDELPITSAGASGQEAPPQDHHTSTPPPAEGEPPRKRSLRSRTKTENDAKTPAKK
ncbi:hypothetical protein NDU88_004382 [Pleurodeles waltl]|uniref:Uncharacterized protein n=1 Tax=Pleurodeles waltl TaxID=8319 RepID=A0AAV7LL81_PLEWA|nr:hypothetical protein NDU88_004382 [Pleurodeles waltl]